jgi:hypothetical protein
VHQDFPDHLQFPLPCNDPTSLDLIDIVCFVFIPFLFAYFSKISGVLLILFGLWTIYYKQDYVGLFSSFLYQASTYVLMAAGAMIVITAILGVTSAWIESKRLVILVN